MELTKLLNIMYIHMSSSVIVYGINTNKRHSAAKLRNDAGRTKPLRQVWGLDKFSRDFFIEVDTVDGAFVLLWSEWAHHETKTEFEHASIVAE